VKNNAILTSRQLMCLAILALPISANAITYQPPIVIDKTYVSQHGSVISGNFQGTTSSPAITVSAGTPVTIINSNVTGPGDLIYGVGVDLTVINTTGVGTNPGQSGVQKGMFVHIEQAVNLLVENNTMSGVRFGVYVNRYVGNFTHAQNIQILNNIVNNVDARPSTGSGYATSGEYNGHAFQLNNVIGVPNVVIAWNQVINTPRQSQCSDLINIFESSGTSASHILIHDNYLQGAYPTNPGTDRYTGGGIITDGQTSDTLSNATGYVDAYNNQVVSTANYGISIAAGHDNNFYNNTVISSGYLSDGSFIPMTFSNGINNYNNYNQPSSVCFNNIAQLNNPVGLIANTLGTNAARRSDYYLPNQSGNTNVSFVPNNNSSPTIADEQAQFTLWQSKLAFHKMKVGVR
jgi:hypothetical protein